ncbi:hypothetical protein D3C84_1060380 [compost metagenome]
MTPMVAVIAKSWITGILMIISTAKPTASAISAIIPVRNRRRKVKRAAISLSAPRPMSCMMPFIFCAPWLRPMANTRKGTKIE